MAVYLIDESVRILDSTGALIDGSNPFPVNIASSSATITTAPAASGTHGNAWNAAVVAADGTSSTIDAQLLSVISAFGNASVATIIKPQFSQDNTNFYTSDITLSLDSNGNFGGSFIYGGRYVRLISSNAATITATIASKGG